MRVAWREGPSLLILAVIVVIAVWGWLVLPDRVPVHWNLQGEADGYGSKLEGLAIVPGVSVGMYLLLLVLPRIDPAGANYTRFAGAYTILRTAMLAFFAVLYAIIVASSAGVPIDVSRSIGIGIGAMFVLLGGVMGRIQRNWLVGIRTPWTLSSEKAWRQTHLWGGRLFIASGLLLGAAIISRSDAVFIAVLLAMFAAIIGLVAYSFIVWRDDPNKIAQPGTAPRP